MAEVIRMPLLSDTMKEGVIAAWHKNVGDAVKADDVIAEVETDKATMEVVPYVEGTLLYIGPQKGEAAKVNEVIAVVGKKGEDYKSLLEKEGGDAPAPKAEAQSGEDSGKGKEEKKAPEEQTEAAEEKPEEKAAAPKKDDAALKAAMKEVTVVRMPLLSDTMKEGKIVSWLKNEGDQVSSDDVLAEVETDKATMEVVGYADGTLLHIGVKAGEAAKVNDIIAIVGKKGTDIQPILDAESSQGGGNEDAGKAEGSGAEDAGKKAAEETATPAAAQKSAAPAAAPAAGKDTDGRMKASPLARKLAEEKNIDLSQVQGTGDGGRIIKRDVDQFTPGAASAQQGAPAAAAPVASGQEGHTDIPLSQMRRTIARRLGESKFNAPHFYLTIEVNMDNAIAARKAMNEVSPVKISFNDMTIKAAAMALRQHPYVNSSWMGDFIRQNKHIHIGSAVAVEEGLIVPVIRFADQLGLSQIAATAQALYEKVRNKKLQPEDYSGNTFTISNLGMMGIEEFTAIINPPDSCILAVGAIKETVVADKGVFKTANIMKLTMSCDHRVVDGAVGARFLQTLKVYLENPVTMLV
ncbi:pyruvate dehydrogenase complex dihydrolipoamide acetyltransferase [Compostibacter hankyongensis]|uniref:Acetyltransferase component of pyruvate dehydrogenase complex n=1 Tax=Compostibacter hankyongensis TaxID=1007089 RepID=A0ABP8G7Z7_9BACT